MALRIKPEHRRCSVCNRLIDQLARVPVLQDVVEYKPNPATGKHEYFMRFMNTGPYIHRCERHRNKHRRMTTDGVLFHVQDTHEIVKKRLKSGQMRVVGVSEGGIYRPH